MVDLRRQNLLSVNDIDPDAVEPIFSITEQLIRDFKTTPGRSQYSTSLQGLVLAPVFTEPSVRTLAGFESAFLRLGGSTIKLPELEQLLSKPAPQESGEDIVSYLTTYVDILTLRTSNSALAQLISEHAKCPIISAGLPNGEHPTSALAQIFALRRTIGLNGHRVLMISEKHCRTFKSLLLLWQKLGQSDLAIYSSDLNDYGAETLNEVSCYDPDSTNFDDILNDDFSIIIYNESERTEPSSCFVDKMRMTNARLEKVRHLQKLIHLKPVVSLLDDEIHSRLRPDFLHQSKVSMLVKQALFLYTLEHIK